MDILVFGMDSHTVMNMLTSIILGIVLLVSGVYLTRKQSIRENKQKDSQST